MDNTLVTTLEIDWCLPHHAHTCVYALTHAYKNTHSPCTHIHTQSCTDTHTHTYTHNHPLTLTHTCTHIHTHAHTTYSAHSFSHNHAHTHAHTQSHTYISTFVHIHIHSHTHMHIHTCIYTHTHIFSLSNSHYSVFKLALIVMCKRKEIVILSFCIWFSSFNTMSKVPSGLAQKWQGFTLDLTLHRVYVPQDLNTILVWWIVSPIPSLLLWTVL